MGLDFLKVTQFVLGKQYLLEGYKATDVIHAAKAMVGIHATDNTAPYLSLFARVKNFEKKHLDHELYQNRSMARVECMRSTLFVVPKEIVPVVYIIYKGGLSVGFLKDWGMSVQEYEEISNRILETLKNKAMTISQIKRCLPNDIQRTLIRGSGKNLVRTTNVKIVLILMMQQGILLSVKRPGTWTTAGPNYYARFVDWFSDADFNEMDRDEAMIQLVKLYIQSYGPVTEKDVSWWSGLKISRVQRLLESLRPEIMKCEICDLDPKFIMLKSDFVHLKHFKPIKKHSISLLPYDDSYVKGYKERERLISHELHNKVYLHGEASPTILIGGRIIGTWKLETRQEELTLTFHLFKEIRRSLLNRVRTEAKALNHFVCADKVKINEL
jgi:hypothetical protein